MTAAEVTGTYTYRSFLNRQEMVGDFNKLKFAELELRLEVGADGHISGELVFTDSLSMDMVGQVSGDSPVTLTLTGKGRPGTSIADFHYEYDCRVLRHWENGINQRMTLAGAVLRAADHGSGASLARAGQTASSPR
ncbi:hypothetical protein AQJ46_48960 [Streptomyces canus]|uniref:Lipid/polyisoprenoid-binding YceI-like domain-containing protein n=1 Tax=Streptomyces canus TaxID=58343 RepID=A0A101RKB4_9ACTN|nr:MULTISPECIES: hypothetical protein [Streptomyces]KUN56036.1 hypothetical protein AQJ46_48960 [Streptomyces canus]MDI5905442.1 hypothetical protein [Streptomyces sp. 12257]